MITTNLRITLPLHMTPGQMELVKAFNRGVTGGHIRFTPPGKGHKFNRLVNTYYHLLPKEKDHEED
jgi:hypothetical protein